jgi:hypothetical protein
MSDLRNHQNNNYRIGTDELADGRMKATARGRKKNVKTFPVGTTHEDAALELATKIEGDRISEVRERSRNSDGTSRDFAVYVSA